MFINPNIVAFVFKLINFALLIGLVAFVFKKHLKATILLLIAQKESAHQQLLAQQDILEHKQHALDIRMQEEALTCQRFKSKIDEWKNAVTSQQQKDRQKHADFLAHIYKRNVDIALKKEQQKLQNKVIGSVVLDLETSLSHEFQHTPKGAEYLTDILHFMKRKAS